MALSIPQGKAVYTTRYTDFKGVDYQSTDECVDPSRFSDCDNLMFDKAGLIEKRLGFRCLNQLDGEIHSMKAVNINGKSELLIHAGSKLYKSDGKTVTPIKQEGYKRYSYLITLPRLVGSHDTCGTIVSRQLGFDIAYNSNSYKIKEMFMVKVSELPYINWLYKSGSGTTHYQKTPEEIKEILDGKSYSQIEQYYRDMLVKNDCDASYSDISPEQYQNLIKNGNFEEGRQGLYKYENGDYEIYANSMRVDSWNGNGCIYQHIPVLSKHINESGYSCLGDKAVFYITFLASEGWAGNIHIFEDTKWSMAQPNPDTIRTYCWPEGCENIMSYDGEKNSLTGGELKAYDTTGIDANIGNSKSSINVYDDKVWITTDNGIFVYDGIDVLDAEKVAYVPTTTALRNVSHTYVENLVNDYKDIPGNSVEPVNLLTRKRINTFCLSEFLERYKYTDDGFVGYTDIVLDETANSVETILYLSTNGTFLELDRRWYQLMGDRKSIRFKRFDRYYAYNTWFETSVPSIGWLDGVTENLRVYFTATTPANYEKKVDKCHITSAFGVGKDDRLFLTGNEKYPNYIWYSEFENFSYIPDINYIVTGDGNTKNLGFTKVNQNLLVHKEGNDQDTTVFMVAGSLDSSGKAVFTVTQGINGVGAISERGFTNFDDMPLFLSDKGIYSVESTNIISEKTVVNRSGYVNPELLKHDLKNAAMTTYDDMVLVSAGGNIYVMYPRKQSYMGKDTVLTAASFEALRWSIPETEVTVFAAFNGGLYFGTKNGKVFKWNNDIGDLSKYNDILTPVGPGEEVRPVKCYFVTKLDDDGSFMSLKTMIKRGCGIMIKPYTQSSVRVYTLTEKEHEKLIKEAGTAIFNFDEFWFNVVDFSSREVGRIIPFNTKVKKYSSLCFKVENNERSQGFGVIGIEKRYTVGNYKKY
ncbi:MAG: hypothetical protein IJE46_06660 [Clostridia bacterium]|nr:hypothetical protein [Clostridia bacterium]